EEEIAALVRGRAVDSEPDSHARVEQLAHGCDTGAESQVRGRAVCDSDAVRTETLHLGLRDIDAVRTPRVLGEPADALQVFDGRATVLLPAIRLFVDGLGEMGVQLQPEPPRECCRFLHQACRHRERRAWCYDD